MSPLLFNLYFDRVIQYIQQRTSPADAVTVAWMAIQAALYADDVALLAPGLTSLQSQVTALAGFTSSASLRISLPKTVVMSFNCTGEICANGQQLQQV